MTKCNRCVIISIGIIFIRIRKGRECYDFNLLSDFIKPDIHI